MRKQPTADPDKLLRVFSEIAMVAGQIEQIQGRLNYLEDVVALATVEVQLTPTVVPHRQSSTTSGSPLKWPVRP